MISRDLRHRGDGAEPAGFQLKDFFRPNDKTVPSLRQVFPKVNLFSLAPSEVLPAVTKDERASETEMRMLALIFGAAIF